MVKWRNLICLSSLDALDVNMLTHMHSTSVCVRVCVCVCLKLVLYPFDAQHVSIFCMTRWLWLIEVTWVCSAASCAAQWSAVGHSGVQWGRSFEVDLLLLLLAINLATLTLHGVGKHEWWWKLPYRMAAYNSHHGPLQGHCRLWTMDSFPLVGRCYQVQAE